MPAALHRQHHRALGIHDVHRAESPAVDFQGFTVVFRGVALTVVKRVRFNDGAVGNACLKGLYHLARQDVGAVALTGVQLNGDFAGDLALDEVIELVEVFGVNHLRKINLCAFHFLCVLYCCFAQHAARGGSHCGGSGQF